MSLSPVKKWKLQRLTAIILIPLLVWFLYSFLVLVYKDYSSAIDFFDNKLNSILFLVFIIFVALHSKIGVGEIIEDYIHSASLKKFLNTVALIYSILMPLIGIISVVYIIIV
ncbi:MAG: succinate dehydrogenase, hydrophobic membrane anchor protein [Candidatus Fonsibacter sp.]|jgi:succinate dehydrogenase / fumarate reductase membrane anchor subunit|nr:succinate dehydrogenase, hydrophobic membrane anchor protein [Pelagibacterales bacterium]